MRSVTFKGVPTIFRLQDLSKLETTNRKHDKEIMLNGCDLIVITICSFYLGVNQVKERLKKN